MAHDSWRMTHGAWQGEHGDTQQLRELLLPLLDRFGVDLYLCGHDHTLQHIEYKNTHFVVSGNGAKEGYIQNFVRLEEDLRTESEDLGRKTHFAVVVPGFTAHVIHSNGKRLTTTFIDGSGSDLHSFTQRPRCKMDCPATAEKAETAESEEGLGTAEWVAVLFAAVLLAGVVGRLTSHNQGLYTMLNPRTREEDEDREGSGRFEEEELAQLEGFSDRDHQQEESGGSSPLQEMTSISPSTSEGGVKV